jgi:hypothetical protein
MSRRHAPVHGLPNGAIPSFSRDVRHEPQELDA